MKVSTILLWIFATLAASTEVTHKAVVGTPTNPEVTPQLSRTAPQKDRSLDVYPPEQQKAILWHFFQHHFPPPPDWKPEDHPVPWKRDASPSLFNSLEKRNACKRGCGVDQHCCSGDSRLPRVRLGPQKEPPKETAKSEPEAKADELRLAEVGKDMKKLEDLPKSQGKLSATFGGAVVQRDHSDEDDGNDGEEVTAANTLERELDARQKCQDRPCTVRGHCCTGYMCLQRKCVFIRKETRTLSGVAHEVQDNAAQKGENLLDEYGIITGDNDTDEDKDEVKDEVKDGVKDKDKGKGSSPVNLLVSRGPCNRGCRVNQHCCPGDSCLYGVCLGPHKPPRASRREIHERYGPADQTKKSEESAVKADGTAEAGGRDKRCIRHCQKSDHCCRSDKCVSGVCLGAGVFF
ncbi:hypothetical protein ETB97_003237 [Aspergillus alliaceus]|uniref:Uncharacterized protein n=1 Tax=Petromyces alliaceus TaxID=209559 RepID=A0A8H6A3D5_PETAA|nr:hypothetical protein ETB97_003237 [Aspergillus burnettii]